jgi:hypothetical protein
MKFLWIPHDTRKFAVIFYKAFLILFKKILCLSHPGPGGLVSFDSPAVRIRVKITKL